MKTKHVQRWQIIVLVGALSGIEARAADQALPKGDCPPPVQGQVLSDQSMKAFSSSADTAESLLPDGSHAAPAKKLPLVRVSVNGYASTGVPKTTVVDLVASDFAAIGNPSSPNYNQAVANIDAAASLFTVATSQTTCVSPSVAKGAGAHANLAISTGGGPIQAPVQNCSPNTFQGYINLLKQNQGMSADAKFEYLSSFLGNTLDWLYNYNAGTKVTPLPTVFQALLTNAKNAGVCRDIHTFIAASGNALGLQCGTTGMDWKNNIGDTGGHVVAQCKDPSTGKYMFINYNDAFSVTSKTLSEANLQAVKDLNNYTTVVNTQSTVDANGNGSLHETQTAETIAIQQHLLDASNMNQPHFTIAIGNLQSSAGAQKKLMGDSDTNLGVFATGVMVTQGDPYQYAAGGVRGNVKVGTQLTDNTQAEVKATVVAGVMDVHAHTPEDTGTATAGQSRNNAIYFATVDMQADYAWNEQKNSGKVGAEFKEEAAAYVGTSPTDGFLPMTQLNVFATDNPTKNVQIHFKNSGFISNQSNYQTPIVYHEQDAALGADVHKNLTANGKVQLQTGGTVHDFDSNAVGLESQSKLTINKSSTSSFSLGADVGYVHNNSQDPYFDYPVTCSAQADYQKTFSRGTLTASGTYNCNNHDAYTLMPQADMANPNGLVVQPKLQGGVTWTFGRKQ